MSYLMKIFSFLILCLFIYSCDSDDSNEETQTGIPPAISGYYLLDTNGDGNFSPVGGKKIILSNSLPQQNCYCDPVLKEVETDETGFYQFDDICLLNDDCKLWVWAALNHEQTPITVRTNIVDTDTNVDGDHHDGEKADSCCIIVTLHDGEIDDGNNFTARTYPNKVSGKVQFDTNGDEIGDAVAEDVSVRIFIPNPNNDYEISRYNGNIPSVICDESGHFEVNGLMPGTYKLWVHYVTYGENHISFSQSFSQVNEEMTIEVEENGIIENINLVVAPN